MPVTRILENDQEYIRVLEEEIERLQRECKRWSDSFYELQASIHRLIEKYA